MPTLALPSATIDYHVVGPTNSAHSPIVFVHGVLVDHRLWAAVADRLAGNGYRCYLPTLPLGSHRIAWTRPDGGDADRSPRGAATLLREFVATLGLADATLVCNDTGGAITQYALDADPEFVARIVFTNCDAFDLFPPQPFKLLFTLLQRKPVLRAAGQLMRVKPIRHSPLGVGLLANDIDADFSDSVFDPIRESARIRDDLTTFLRHIDPADLATVTPRMHRVTRPVTMVWGADDRCFTPSHGRTFAEVFPDAHFIEVPRARTFVALDQPGQVADEVVAISHRSDPADTTPKSLLRSQLSGESLVEQLMTERREAAATDDTP